MFCPFIMDGIVFRFEIVLSLLVPSLDLGKVAAVVTPAQLTTLRPGHASQNRGGSPRRRFPPIPWALPYGTKTQMRINHSNYRLGRAIETVVFERD